MSVWGTIGIALGSALLSALAAGGVQIGLELWERKTRRKVASMVILGDVGVTEGIGRWIADNERWPDYEIDFSSPLTDWAEQRVAFADVALADRLAASAAKAWAVVIEHIGLDDTAAAAVLQRLGTNAQ